MIDKILEMYTKVKIKVVWFIIIDVFGTCIAYANVMGIISREKESELIAKHVKVFCRLLHAELREFKVTSNGDIIKR